MARDVRAAPPRHHGLADAADPRHRHHRPALGRRRHLPRRLDRRQAPRHQHEHARRARHRRRLRLQRVRHPLARPGRALGAAAAPVLRDRAGRRRAGADGPLAGAAGQEAHRRLDPRPRRPRAHRPPASLRDGTEVDVPRRRGPASATWSGSAPARSCPVDGVVTDGASAVDESMLTGESVPGRQARRRHRHRRHDQPHRHRSSSATTAVGADSTLAQIIRLVEDAQGSQAADAAARRPGLGLVRARRAARPRWPPSSAGCCSGPDGDRLVLAIGTTRRRADHRLPLRARAGHARPRSWSAPARPPSSAS